MEVAENVRRGAVVAALMIVAHGCASEDDEMLEVVPLPQAAALQREGQNASLTPPDPSKPYISKVTLTGKGCPEGTFYYTWATDQTFFTVQFEEYEATVDPDSKLYDTRDCLLNVAIRKPPGVEVGLARFSYQGSMNLDEGVQGWTKATYSFAGLPLSPNRDVLQIMHEGPTKGDWGFSYNDTLPAGTMPWDGCQLEQPVLQIRTFVTVRNTTSPKRVGHIRLETAAGAVGAVGKSADAGVAASEEEPAQMVINLARRPCTQ